MLALPAVSAPAGILPTSLSLTAIWGLLTLDALLIAEVNLAVRAARSSIAGGSSGGGIVTLRQMAEFTLGKAGKGEWALLLRRAGRRVAC
jgi:tyrosine-specific transport protein